MESGKRNIVVVGTGYVGLVTGVCFAEMGNRVVCIDTDRSRIDILKAGEAPFYEPGIEGLLRKNIKKGNLSFGMDLSAAAAQSDVVFITVGTPSAEDGKADLSCVKKVAREIGESIAGYTVVAVKSTVPPGTCNEIRKIIGGCFDGLFDVVSNPEFLREGSAIVDFMKPDRVVIGANSDRARNIMKKLYEPLGCAIFATDLESSEMIKYSSNAFLATKISFINEVANLCESVGADVEEVARGMGMDQRIGKDFLKAGLGYGGSCFPKDVRALCYAARSNGDSFRILESVMEVNECQYKRVVDRAVKILGGCSGKTIGVWGLSFKANTDDIRESAAIKIIEAFRRDGALVKAYDSLAIKNAEKALHLGGVIFCDDPYQAIDGCDLLLITTDGEEFRKANVRKMRQKMRCPHVIDGRNLFDVRTMKNAGFLYESIGR